MKRRSILYPTQSILDERWLLPLCGAAARRGDAGFYATYLEREYADREGVWFIACDDLAPYQALPWTSVANALVSPSGHWGVLVSNESVSVLGTDDDAFAERFRDELDRPLEAGVNELLEYYQHYAQFGTSVDALSRLLSHIFGGDQAEQLLASFDLSPD
jgi:hypothetical protein